jgi:hypothetical protein
MENWKGFRGKWTWHNESIIIAFAWRDWRKPREARVSVAGVATEIWMEHLLNIIIGQYCYTTRLSVKLKLFIPWVSGQYVAQNYYGFEKVSNTTGFCGGCIEPNWVVLILCISPSILIVLPCYRTCNK